MHGVQSPTCASQDGVQGLFREVRDGEWFDLAQCTSMYDIVAYFGLVLGVSVGIYAIHEWFGIGRILFHEHDESNTISSQTSLVDRHDH